MIVALEGMDGCGKSTLFRLLAAIPALRFNTKIKFIDWGPFSPEAWSMIELIEQRDYRQLKSTYQPDTVYICDRFCAITGPVYADVYNREIRKFPGPWDGELHVVYLKLDAAICATRLAKRGGEMSEILTRLRDIDAAYRSFFAVYSQRVHVIDGMNDVRTSAAEIMQIIEDYGKLAA